jgi:hypothetical protein
LNYPLILKTSWFDALFGYKVQAIDSTGAVVLVGEMKPFSGVLHEMTIFADVDRTRVLYRIRVASAIGPSRFVVATPSSDALGSVEGRWGLPWRQMYRIADAAGRTVGVIRRQRLWALWVALFGAAVLGIAASFGLFLALLLLGPPALYVALVLLVLVTFLLGWALRSVVRASYAVEVPEGTKALLLGAAKTIAGWRITKERETSLPPEAEQLVIPALIAFVFGQAVNAGRGRR